MDKSNNNDDNWGMRWAEKDDGQYHQELLLPSGTIVDTGLIAAPVRNTLGSVESLVCIVSTRNLKGQE